MTIDLAKLRAETLALIDGTTPGPWFRDCWDVLGSGAGTGTGAICDVAHPNGDDSKYWKHGEADANVKLIAAAPTLAADALRLLDEIERLRGVLSPIVNHALFHDREYLSQELNEKLDAARAALAEGDPDDR